MSGKPSEPLARQGAQRHSTYVPPLGTPAVRPLPARHVPARAVAVRTKRADPAPARKVAPAKASPVPARAWGGRVPVTTFRVAPAPAPRRIAALPPISGPAVSPPRAPRQTTWSPRPVPVAPARAGALPAPSVAKVSPSYAELERTRAHTVTARQRPQAKPTHRRTLQRRPANTTLKRRAVRSNDLTVPMAPGQNAPRTPVRRSLRLVPPPGCDGGG